MSSTKSQYEDLSDEEELNNSFYQDDNFERWSLQLRDGLRMRPKAIGQS